MNVVISGSFSRHWSEISDLRARLLAAGCDVLAPHGDPEGVLEGFIHLTGNDNKTPKELEQLYLDAISQADIHFIVCPDDVLGKSTLLEIGYAMHAHIPVYCETQLTEEPFAKFCTHASAEQALADHTARDTQAVYETGSLQQMQARYTKTCEKFGFDTETLAEVMMLFMEEVGELCEHISVDDESDELVALLADIEQLGKRAKIVRKGSKVATEQAKAPKPMEPVGGELADLQLYLLHFAQSFGIKDFGLEVANKERVNEKRLWGSN